jgi:hypothetical protein
MSFFVRACVRCCCCCCCCVRARVLTCAVQIPESDYKALHEAGVAAVFGPGYARLYMVARVRALMRACSTRIPHAAEQLLKIVENKKRAA